ncbi:MAG: hypothetical protein JNN04_17090 [Cyclobacteriaceae bacterium]|nr:hypothetical protein [Cyclobacteriaceae bacterium]
MKKLFLFISVLAFALAGCGGPSKEGQQGDSDAVNNDPNQVLYDQVMDIHDEVMPRTEDLHNLKKKLQEQIAATPDMVVEERQKLERRIARLDSVDKMMMDWMHYFDLPDSLTDEARREYLETQMEKIKQVREAILEAIASEKGSN